jgi:hypothetical protein
MATYAENAAARERASRKLVQDRQLNQQYAAFDLSAQDNHMKYERPSFIVVTASDAYRKGWDAIFGSKET